MVIKRVPSIELSDFTTSSFTYRFFKLLLVFCTLSEGYIKIQSNGMTLSFKGNTIPTCLLERINKTGLEFDKNISKT